MSIIIKPYITEKSLAEASRGRYSFVVAKNSTKPQIRKAVKEVFEADTVSIQTRVVKGKSGTNRKNRRKIVGKGFKKAIVSLKEGQKISLFEVGAKEKEKES